MTSDAESSIDCDAEILPFPSRRIETPPVESQKPSDPLLIREAIGEVLREERHRQDRTLQEVAEEAFVSIAHLSELERGLKEGSSEVIESITRALGIEVSEVLERSADRLRVGMGGTGTVLSLAA